MINMNDLDRKILFKQQLVRNMAQNYPFKKNFDDCYFVLNGQVLQNDAHLILCSILNELYQIDSSKLVHNLEISQFYDLNPESNDFSTYHELCAKYSNAILTTSANTGKCNISTGSVKTYLKTIVDLNVQYHRIEIVYINFGSIPNFLFDEKHDLYTWPNWIPTWDQTSTMARGKCQSEQIRKISNDKNFCMDSNQYHQTKIVSNIFKTFRQASIQMQIEQLFNKNLLPNATSGINQLTAESVAAAISVSKFIQNTINKNPFFELEKDDEIFFIIIPYSTFNHNCALPKINLAIDSFLTICSKNTIDKFLPNIQFGFETKNFGIWIDQNKKNYVQNGHLDNLYGTAVNNKEPQHIPYVPYVLYPNISTFSKHRIHRQFQAMFKKNISLDQTNYIAKIKLNGQNHIEKYDLCLEK